MSSVSPDTKLRLPLSAMGGIIFAIGLSGGALAVAQFRIDALDERVADIERTKATDRELLVRIDERTTEIKRQLEESRRGVITRGQ
jgi:hypothetical protein